MSNEGKKKVKARRLGKNGKSPAGNSWSCTGAEWGSAGIKIMIMNDLAHLLRTEEGREIAMICQHSDLDGYLRLFPGFRILGYSRKFENSPKSAAGFTLMERLVVLDVAGRPRKCSTAGLARPDWTGFEEVVDKFIERTFSLDATMPSH
jgi:hypothetical protein